MLVRNKYMRWGIWLLIAGVLLVLLGEYLKTQDTWYGGALTLGVVLFIAGFVLFFYSLLRKIDRRSLLRERRVEQQKNDSEGINP
ncbi:signal peptidase [Pedobacter sp. HMF7647]|uniref:Signal peptidase n=1 Tax=Hufsiella arboris TaxID=2695275 RepID=A0A7K1Y942_9SPHI|nr:signal peptidase [Hufsiella arboris]MXV51097.1 signal peptidase [Hufsiella arboris]